MTTKFFELCSKNRGLNIDVFTNYEDVIQWFYDDRHSASALLQAASKMASYDVANCGPIGSAFRPSLGGGDEGDNYYQYIGQTTGLIISTLPGGLISRGKIKKRAKCTPLP